MRTLRREIEAEFGISTRLPRVMVGPVLLWTSIREDRRLADGVTYEPETFIERHDWVEKSGTVEQSKLVVMPKRGFAPSLKNIAARLVLPEQPALTEIGE